MNGTQIYQISSGVVTLIQTGAAVFDEALKFMDAIESYKSMSGAEKKAWVLAKIKDVIYDNGFDMDAWLKKVANFIDDAISAFNTLKKYI